MVLLPGDGIGPEVTAQAERVLSSLGTGFREIEVRVRRHSVGAGEFLSRGDPLPSEAMEACSNADAVLMGAMGMPSVRWPDGRELTPQLDLREKLDLYCSIRPARLYHPEDSPLRTAREHPIDLVVVREGTEGLFSSRLKDGQATGGNGDARSDLLQITRRGAERLFRAAFRLALQRRHKLTLVDKANVLPSMVFFRSIFDEVAAEFPEVTADRIYVDAATLYLVQQPESFDVIVTENMFGDIISDLASAVVGGMGVACAADIGDSHGVFQPSHGSAPDIAGKGIANPTAAVLCVAMMLEWLAHEETLEAAHRIRASVEKVLANPRNRTPDLGGNMSTRDMGDLFLYHL